MKLIKLTQGLTTMVDDDIFDELNKYRWFSDKVGNNLYARMAIYSGANRGKKTRMHRMVLRVNDKKIKIDHIDGNGLNNQRSNLRVCTTSQNAMNKRKETHSSSQYKGVTVETRNGKRVRKYFRSCIVIGGKKINLGHFPHTSEGEKIAAELYNINAQKYFGEFAKLNNINQ